MNKLTKIKVTKRGAPILTDYKYACVIQRGKKIVALYIDMKSKRCELDGSIEDNKGNVGIMIGTTEDSIYLDEKCNRDDWTEIFFPEFKGWKLLCGNISRYSCTICLVKDLGV